MSIELEEYLLPKVLDEQSPIENIYSHLSEEFPTVYSHSVLEKDPSRKPVILLSGFSGSGKDSVFCPLLESHEAKHLVTATSRKRRVEKNEPEDAYVWMRERNEGESLSEYYEHLVDEYSLVEFDVHYGNLYGLPLSSLEKDGDGLPVVRTDIHGVKTLKKNLLGHGFQAVSVGIMPDSWSQVYHSVLGRDNDDEKARLRFMEDVESLGLYTEDGLFDYFIHNTRNSGIEGKSGLDISIDGLRYIVKKFSNNQ